MITIKAPTTLVLSWGALREYALDLVTTYSEITRDKVWENAVYENIPNHATIWMNEVAAIISLWGEIEGLETFIKVSNLDSLIPTWLPYSHKTDEEWNEIQKLWRDLESSTNKWTLANDNEYFIWTHALKWSLFTWSELMKYEQAKVNVLAISEIRKFLINSEM
jgi:hypothetical protein